MFTKQEYLEIANVLNQAADEYLWHPELNLEFSSRYTRTAIFCVFWYRVKTVDFSTVQTFLTQERGFDLDTNHLIEMEEIVDDEIVQTFRYDWLKFAAMYAEEKAKEILMLSDVFHLAANKYLADEYLSDTNNSTGKSEYSCDAIGFAVGEFVNAPFRFRLTQKILDLLKECGLDSSSMNAFKDCYNGKDPQGCRYMWLKMLAEYAESEQIEAKEFIS